MINFSSPSSLGRGVILLSFIFLFTFSLVSASNSLGYNNPSLPHLEQPISSSIIQSNNTYNNITINNITGQNQTPWLSDIDGFGFDLTNVSDVFADNLNANVINTGNIVKTGTSIYLAIFNGMDNAWDMPSIDHLTVLKTATFGTSGLAQTILGTTSAGGYDTNIPTISFNDGYGGHAGALVGDGLYVYGTSTTPNPNIQLTAYPYSGGIGGASIGIQDDGAGNPQMVIGASSFTFNNVPIAGDTTFSNLVTFGDPAGSHVVLNDPSYPQVVYATDGTTIWYDFSPSGYFELSPANVGGIDYTIADNLFSGFAIPSILSGGYVISNKGMMSNSNWKTDLSNGFVSAAYYSYQSAMTNDAYFIALDSDSLDMTAPIFTVDKNGDLFTQGTGTFGGLIVNGNTNITGNLTADYANFNQYHAGMFTSSETGVASTITLNASFQPISFHDSNHVDGFMFNTPTNNTLQLKDPQGAGHYQVIWEAQEIGVNNHNYIGCIFVNGVQQNNTLGHATGQASNAIDLHGEGFIELANNDNVTLRIKDTTGTTVNPTVYVKNVNLIRFHK